MLGLIGDPDVFSPAQYGGLVLNHDAYAITGLSHGEALGTWTDLSASASDATQTTADQKPLYKIVGGYPEVEFDGTDDCLLQTLALSGAKSIYIVYKVASLAAGSLASLISLKNVTFTEWTISNAASGYQDISGKHGIGTSPAASVGFNQAYDTSWHILTVTYNGGTNTNVASYAGGRDGTGTVVTSGNFSRVADNKGSIGARVAVDDAVQFPLNGSLRQIIVYNVQRTAAESERIRWGLTRRWGVALV